MIDDMTFCAHFHTASRSWSVHSGAASSRPTDFSACPSSSRSRPTLTESVPAFCSSISGGISSDFVSVYSWYEGGDELPLPRCHPAGNS